jgi:hypothetical protein
MKLLILLSAALGILAGPNLMRAQRSRPSRSTVYWINPV